MVMVSSIKPNPDVVAVAALMGLTMSGSEKPVCEGLLNDLAVTAFNIGEVATTGRVLAIVGITTDGVEELRPVCDAKGVVRIYPNADGAVAVAKRANLSAGVQVKFTKMPRATSLGDPVIALKNKHKAFKAEDVAAGKSVVLLATKIAAAVGLGWDTATGTPEADEYANLQGRKDSIDEWKAYVAARVVTLAAALTAAGIDPATYLPIP